MELTGLEPRRSDLARGVVIARSTHALDHATQRALWRALGEAGITEDDDDSSEDPEEPARRWHAAPWLPPTSDELAAQRAAFERAAEQFQLEAIWCVKLETAIDGIAWVEAAAETAQAEDVAEPDDDPSSELVGDEPEPAPEPAEVLYAAPDADANPPPLRVEPRDEAEVEPDDAISQWREGPPPLADGAPFPIERYPEIIADYDWESFGVAIKLARPTGDGEESVINAFFALWLSVYQDERVSEYEPFQRADVVHDRAHASALMWVERFAVPATAADQVHFLLWVIVQLHNILPIAWARFETVDDSVKARAAGDTTGAPFVLAGNPLADRFHRSGEQAALTWAVAQSAWSRRELAGMLVEVALEHDPDDTKAAAVAERLLRRALAFDPQSDATGYLAIVLVRQRRVAEAHALATLAPRDVRMLVVSETAEHRPDQLGSVLDLIDSEVGAAGEELADLVATVARHAPAELDRVLDRLPSDGSLIPHLYNTSFTVERREALKILRCVLRLPEPPREASEPRTAYVMAWNNACIHAHALADYRLAVELADGGQPYAPENPYIYHSAACAYAAVGSVDRALEQVSLAIDHDYEHTEKMETDQDLALLQRDPRFAALFSDWRGRRADLN